MTELTLPTRKLEGKVAIITGGANGIGEATVRLFANHGARAIVIADIQDEKGQRVADSIGPQCSFIHCDVADEDQVKAMVESTVRIHGHLDIMFSNAGIVSKSDQLILDLNFLEYEKLFSINAKGMAACVKHAARVMVEKRVRGSIICTASVAGSKSSHKRTDYCMSKHAVVGLVRSASRQLGGHGIRVNCVSPSMTATSLLVSAYQKSPQELEMMFENFSSLKGVVLKTQDVAEAVLFLASGDSQYITGHDLKVDGGFLAS